MENKNLTQIERNDTCVVCGQKFKPRKDKLYCSDNCKQKAYNDRKQLAEIDDPENKLECLSPDAMQNILYTFYYKEYERVIQKAKERKKNTTLLELNLEQYCFFRKNLSGEVSIDFIIDYIDKFDVEDLLNEGRTLKKKYNEFLEIYHTRSITLNKLPEYLKEITEIS